MTLAVTQPDALGEAVGDADADGEALEETLRQPDPESEGDTEGDAQCVPDTEIEGLVVPLLDGDGQADAVLLAHAEGQCEPDAV